ncbi:MAG TPA: hypothetical protein IAC62_05815 [Candidatus Pelethocola excrementipullorum]|nr:hypothetical protein [Candidatus Pelethocola excrementipullorum]
MEDKLRAYMDHLFRDVKPTRSSVELKEEIIQNLVDKYHDMLAEGKTPEAAYNIAVASVGDTDELLAGLHQEKKEEHFVSDEAIERGRRKSALLTSVAVMMYIVSVIPPIIISETTANDSLGPIIMFLIVALATGLLIYNNMTKPRYRKMDDSIVEEFKEWQNQNDSNQRAMKSISSAMWSIIVVIYFVVSFTTMAWYITWVIFLIGAAIDGIMKAVFELRKQG